VKRRPRRISSHYHRLSPWGVGAPLTGPASIRQPGTVLISPNSCAILRQESSASLASPTHRNGLKAQDSIGAAGWVARPDIVALGWTRNLRISQISPQSVL
jgi:hypothetical protein